MVSIEPLSSTLYGIKIVSRSVYSVNVQDNERFFSPLSFKLITVLLFISWETLNPFFINIKDKLSSIICPDPGLFG